MMGFKNFHTAHHTLKGIKAMQKKGQIEEIQCVHSKIQFINRIFGLSA